jgi:hypothetical protein
VTPVRDLVLLGVGLVLDRDLLRSARPLGDHDLAVDLADDRGVPRTATFEELGHARETARDVARLRGLAPDRGHHVSDPGGLAVLDLEARAGRERVRAEHVLVRVDDLDVRMELLLAVFRYRNSLLRLSSSAADAILTSTSARVLLAGVGVFHGLEEDIAFLTVAPSSMIIVP